VEFSGSHRFRQTPQAIWAALNDPEVLRATIPGCQQIERVSDTLFSATVRITVGPMKLRFAGQITLSDLDPPWRYTIACEGSGGLAGLARGRARVTIAPIVDVADGTGAVLHYQAETALSGMVATLAEKLLHGTADRLAGQFFEHFASHIPEPEPTAAAAATIDLPKEDQTVTRIDDQPGLHPVVWTLGLTTVTAIILAMSIR
jgi:carbon monoxide dehydrogenase subunit G